MVRERQQVKLSSGHASAVVDLDAGGRLASLEVFGEELLVDAPRPGPDTPVGMTWGCFPMAPWAGRTRDGRFTFEGVEHRLEPNLGPHAAHGVVFDRPWREAADGWIERPIGGAGGDAGDDGWPFPGLVRQRFTLGDNRLQLELEVHTDGDPMPASCGWHPGLRRQLGHGGPAELRFEGGSMLRRDDSGIATDQRVAPGTGPWDDCFVGIEGPVVVAWPGALTLEVTSSCAYVVIYDQQEEALCVEPQTHPPDALTTGPTVVRPGEPLRAEATFTWLRPPQ